ncbi:Nucleic acid-binding, OB-fold [Sesbania bispinosa]|nr:Nucleic acid-binding, OB-fold [Sesbania bispinosa]
MSACLEKWVTLNDISPTIHPWFTRVQVIRIWPTTFCSHPTRVLSVEIVFIDAQGTKIQGSISRDILRMRRITMEEGHEYEIQRASVVPNNGKDRPTSHPFRLVFNMNSIIVLLETTPLISYGLSPVTTIDIVRITSPTEILVDKVGILTSISSEREYVKDGKYIKAISLEIRDPTGKTECVLYDEYVEDVKQFLKRHGPTTPIVVVQFARVVSKGEVVLGEAAVESVQNLARILFNPTIPEVFNMKKWLVINGIKLDNRVEYINLHMPNLTLRDEFLLYHPRRQIAQVLSREELGLFVVWGRIISLMEEENWWFTESKHHTCASQGNPLQPCDGYFSVIPRYHLKVEVFDNEDECKFLLGDEDVHKLLDVSCKDLLPSIEDPNSELYPPIFEKLIDKSMLFLVEKKFPNSYVNDGYFKVKRVCDVPELIRMYLRGQFFRLHHTTRDTVAKLLGVEGPVLHSNNAHESSHASALAVDNFSTTASDIAQASSSNSVSFNNQNIGITPNIPVEESDVEPVDKHCLDSTP